MTTENNAFENAKHIDETGNEYWSARTLQTKQGGLQPTETTAKQQADWWAEAHPTVDTTAPHPAAAGKKRKTTMDMQSKAKKLIEMIQTAPVEWKPLGEVVNIKNGKDWKKLSSGDIPVYGSGGVMGYVDTFAYDKPSVLI